MREKCFDQIHSRLQPLSPSESTFQPLSVSPTYYPFSLYARESKLCSPYGVGPSSEASL